MTPELIIRFQATLTFILRLLVASEDLWSPFFSLKVKKIILNSDLFIIFVEIFTSEMILNFKATRIRILRLLVVSEGPVKAKGLIKIFRANLKCTLRFLVASNEL